MICRQKSSNPNIWVQQYSRYWYIYVLDSNGMELWKFDYDIWPQKVLRSKQFWLFESPCNFFFINYRHIIYNYTNCTHLFLKYLTLNFSGLDPDLWPIEVFSSQDILCYLKVYALFYLFLFYSLLLSWILLIIILYPYRFWVIFRILTTRGQNTFHSKVREWLTIWLLLTLSLISRLFSDIWLQTFQGSTITFTSVLEYFKY